MKGLDTLDKGPSKLLLQDWDCENYVLHKKMLNEIKPVMSVANGEHILPISKSKGDQQVFERNMNIEKDNKILFEKI